MLERTNLNKGNSLNGKCEEKKNDSKYLSERKSNYRKQTSEGKQMKKDNSGKKESGK